MNNTVISVLIFVLIFFIISFLISFFVKPKTMSKQEEKANKYRHDAMELTKYVKNENTGIKTNEYMKVFYRSPERKPNYIGWEQEK